MIHNQSKYQTNTSYHAHAGLMSVSRDKSHYFASMKHFKNKNIYMFTRFKCSSSRYVYAFQSRQYDSLDDEYGTSENTPMMQEVMRNVAYARKTRHLIIIFSNNLTKIGKL